MSSGQLSQLNYGRKRRKEHANELREHDRNYKEKNREKIKEKRKYIDEMRRKQIKEWIEGKYDK